MANEILRGLESCVSRLDRISKAPLSSLTDEQGERYRATISKIRQICTRLEAKDANIEHAKRKRADKLLADGNARLSGPQKIVQGVIENNLLGIFQENLLTGTPRQIAAFLHTADPDVVLRFCAMVRSREWNGHMTWDIFSRLITRMEGATSPIWNRTILLMFSRLKEESLGNSKEYRVFYGILPHFILGCFD
jgi:exonuclease VII small subunit